MIVTLTQQSWTMELAAFGYRWRVSEGSLGRGWCIGDSANVRLLTRDMRIVELPDDSCWWATEAEAREFLEGAMNA